VIFINMNVKSLFFLIVALQNFYAEELFPLSIVHLNDMHARFEEVNSHANTCKSNNSCIGGYARVISMVKELKRTRPNPLFLNAADNFQGTLWYNVFRWNVTQYFLNLHPADAMVIICFHFNLELVTMLLLYYRLWEITSLMTVSKVLFRF
jgi:5'-nucleotidase